MIADLVGQSRFIETGACLEDRFWPEAELRQVRVVGFPVVSGFALRSDGQYEYKVDFFEVLV